MQKKLPLLITISGLVVGLDQAIKLYVHTHMHLGDSIPLLENLLHMTYVRNHGAAFGFLAQAPEQFRQYFFLSMPPLALLFVLVILRTVESRDLLQICALSSIFGGAIGNYIDRLRHGYVIDFIDVHWGSQYSFPVFNIADMAVVGGAGVLMILLSFELFEQNRKKSPRP